MRQLYSLIKEDPKAIWADKVQLYWAERLQDWVKEPCDRDIYTKAWIDKREANPAYVRPLVDKPKNYVYIYDAENGKEWRDRRKTPFAYLQWGDDLHADYKAYRSEEELKAAALQRWNQAEMLGTGTFPVAYVHRAFCMEELSDDPDFYFERGPRGGARKVTA